MKKLLRKIDEIVSWQVLCVWAAVAFAFGILFWNIVKDK